MLVRGIIQESKRRLLLDAWLIYKQNFCLICHIESTYRQILCWNEPQAQGLPSRVDFCVPTASFIRTYFVRSIPSGVFIFRFIEYLLGNDISE